MQKQQSNWKNKFDMIMSTIPTVLADKKYKENHRAFFQIFKRPSHREGDSSEEEDLIMLGGDSEGEDLLQINNTREPAMFEVGIPAKFAADAALPTRRSDEFCIESGQLVVDETDFARLANVCKRMEDKEYDEKIPVKYSVCILTNFIMS